MSRSAFLELCQYRSHKLESIVGTLEREKASDSFLQEKMEFFGAIEDGRLVLGDTLLHIAVRLGHVEVMYYLIDRNCREDVMNFNQETVGDVVPTPAFSMVIHDMTMAHTILGFDCLEIRKALQYLKSLRKLWCRWMFNANECST